ncbi:hypothetical protein Tco_0696246 [Tanacetum coccineum]
MAGATELRLNAPSTTAGVRDTPCSSWLHDIMRVENHPYYDPNVATSSPTTQLDKAILNRNTTPIQVKELILQKSKKNELKVWRQQVAVIIAKELDVEEKIRSRKGAKVPQRAPAWKLLTFRVSTGILYPQDSYGRRLCTSGHVVKTMEVFMDDFSVFGILSKMPLRLDHMLHGCKARLTPMGSPPQAFDFKVNVTKGAEKPRSPDIFLCPDWKTRMKNVHVPKEINESFPLVTLNMVTFRGDARTPLVCGLANYLAGRINDQAIVGTAMMLLRFSQLAQRVHGGHHGANLTAKSSDSVSSGHIYKDAPRVQKALPTMDAELFAISEIYLRQIGAPRALIVIAETISVNDRLTKVMQKYGEYRAPGRETLDDGTMGPSAQLTKTHGCILKRLCMERHAIFRTSWCTSLLELKEANFDSGYHQKDRKPSQNDKTEHGMEKTVQNQGQSPKMPKSESILKNTIECNLYPSDGPGKPNSISMKTVKTKWALNHLQQPICVHLTKTVKTLKAQS